MKYGFIYVWFDKNKKRYYLGRHWGTETDGYISSSTVMKKAYKSRPNDFKRKIVSKVFNKDELIKEEQRWLDMIEPKELNSKYYNITNRASTPSMRGKSHSIETKLKMRYSALKRVVIKEIEDVRREKLRLANIGKKNSQETIEKRKNTIKTNNKPAPKCSEAKKLKIRLSHLGKKLSKEHIENISKSLTGKVCSEEKKLKISIANKGKIRSHETKQKLRELKLGKPWSEKRRATYNRNKGLKLDL